MCALICIVEILPEPLQLISTLLELLSEILILAIVNVALEFELVVNLWQLEDVCNSLE